MKARDIIALVFGSLAFIGINVLAFVFDAEWIKDAMAIDIMVLTAIVTYYFVSRKSENNSRT